MKLYVTVEAGEYGEQIEWVILTDDRPTREDLNTEGKKFSSIIRALVDNVRASRIPSTEPESQEKQHTSQPSETRVVSPFSSTATPPPPVVSVLFQYHAITDVFSPARCG